MTGHIIRWVDELDDRALPHAGSKIARLGALRRWGVQVPDGFVVTTDAYTRFMDETGVLNEVDTILSEISDMTNSAQIADVCGRARSAIERQPMPQTVADALIHAYDELSYRDRNLNVPVAVRSSATGEDAQDASFAGQFDTFLGVTGSGSLRTSVQRCWASLFSDRAVAYRMESGLDHRESSMAVGVLELVDARASGVAFSIHPVSGNPHRLVVEGSWGWGEAVVQGLVTPDHIEVGKSDRRVLNYRIAQKTVVSAFDYTKGRVAQHAMPRRMQSEAILNGEELQAVVEAVLAIEARYGHPVDVEWVIDRSRRPGDPVTIVQTRPVTVAAAEEPPTWDPVRYAAKYAFGNRA